MSHLLLGRCEHGYGVHQGIIAAGTPTPIAKHP